MVNTLIGANPLLYRSYLIDTGTGLYYLQSRYYDPQLGRFLNADGLISTGCGMLGYNMIAYCNNNPVIYEDVTGHAPWPCFVIVEDCPGLDYMDELEDIGVKYYPSDTGNGGKIKNSYRITDVTEMTKYATYLVTKSPYKDNVSGSVEGIVYEWWLHNQLYSMALEYGWDDMALRAKDLDFGKTIYDDGPRLFSYVMWGLYTVSWPDQAKSDLAIHKENGGS